MVIKKICIKLLSAALFCSLILAACLSPWKGDEGTFSITVGNSAESRAVWPLDIETIAQLTHVITLSGGPGPEQSASVNGEQTIAFTVTPGDWKIAIEGYLGRELYSVGVRNLKIKSGSNGLITVTMRPPDPFTVTFDSNGGSAVDSQSVNKGGTVTRPNPPSKEGYVFDDWYTDNKFEKIWDFENDTVSEDMTLYAQWEEAFGSALITIVFWKDEIIYNIPSGGVDILNLLPNQQFSVTVDDPNVLVFEWSIAGYPVAGSIDENGKALSSITIRAADYNAGEYLLVLVVWKDGKPYSAAIKFIVK
jgi:uncharacterized repeat protein (TIGR02543 family)